MLVRGDDDVKVVSKGTTTELEEIMLTSDSEILITGVAITVSETLAVGREELKNAIVGEIELSRIIDVLIISGTETDVLDRITMLDGKSISMLVT